MYDRAFPSTAAAGLSHVITERSREDGLMSMLRGELPAYTQPGSSTGHEHVSRERQIHTYHLQNGNKVPWATLRMKSRAPSARSLPIYFEGQSVTGQVELDLRKPERIKAVIVSVLGVISTRNDEKAFFKHSETLWNSTSGDPRSLEPLLRRPVEKLLGKYSWPFSIALPEEVIIDEKLMKEYNLGIVERLPPNLMGQGWHPTINYKLIVDIKRHGVFRPDNSITTLFGYTPLTRPGLPSRARQRSYRERQPLLGPSLDPNGWMRLGSIEVTGELFKQRKVSLDYSFFLATPSAYTRGSIIPCNICLKSTDKLALDLLSSPSAPRIVLRRQLTSDVDLLSAERELVAREDGESQVLSQAIFAPATQNEYDQPNNTGVYYTNIMGELSVPLSCTPSFSFGVFDLKYFVDVFPPSITGFQAQSDTLLFSKEVEIASSHPEGVSRPRAYITPALDVSYRVTALNEQADFSLGDGSASVLSETLVSFASRAEYQATRTQASGEISRPRRANRMSVI